MSVYKIHGQEGIDTERTHTEHVEPLEQGGGRYIRCESCGRELLVCLGGRDKLVHKAECPNARD